jgi:hypothetical protein
MRTGKTAGEFFKDLLRQTKDSFKTLQTFIYNYFCNLKKRIEQTKTSGKRYEVCTKISIFSTKILIVSLPSDLSLPPPPPNPLPQPIPSQ